MIGVAVKMSGPSRVAIYEAFRDLVAERFPHVLPEQAADFASPWLTRGYRIDAHAFRRILTVAELVDDEWVVTDQWDRGWHADFLLSRVDLSKPPVVERLLSLG